MTEPADSSFPKSRRVVRSTEFGRILRQGKCVADGTLVLCALPSQTGQPPRLGVTIPKKMGSATERNRWKRLIRESFRTQQHALPTGYDFVVRPKKGARPDWEQVQKSVPKLARRATQAS